MSQAAPTAAATRARVTRQKIIRDIKAASPGDASRALAAEHLESPHPALSTLLVRDLVLACRGVGRWQARKLLSAAEIQGDALVGPLMDRKRAALVRALRKPRPHENQTGPRS